ncbi:Macrolide export ATP-binding/permease protein MacB [Pirellulimonas nuda]|uniref:Macrolide export ATP-binding/permease protein MacB n=1 Tax=Pirellulimonas nuda TaxID=2528009 RepID=A0A518DJA5_9BACT|nr:ABC transporter permease [Pirellulimonas nuda]QDU91548.1 Macrolide export ATP-binding/permease protein MacB [Pirellulimonas nuda]
MRFHRLIVANLLNRPLRTALTTLGVAIAVCAVVALVGVSGGFERSLRDAYESRGIDLLLFQKGQLQHISSALPEGLRDRVAALPGVAACEPMLIDVLALDASQLFGVQAQGWRPESFFMQQLELTAGRLPSGPGARQIVLGAELARGIGKGPGDTVELIEGEPFEVCGVYESANVFENGWIVLPIAALQELMLREGDVTGFAVIGQSHDRAALAELAGQIEGVDPRIKAAIARDFAENASELKIAGTLAWMTSSIAVVVGALAVLNTMLMSVFERTGELAVLRALGWRRGRVVALVLGEALAITLLGAVLGNLLGLGVVWLLSLTESGGRVVSGEVSPLVLVQGALVAVILGLLGGLYPAWRAACLEPTDGLRHD